MEAFYDVNAGFSEKELQNILKCAGSLPCYIDADDSTEPCGKRIAISPAGIHANYQDEPCTVNILLDRRCVEFNCLLHLHKEYIRDEAKRNGLSLPNYQHRMQAAALDIGSIDPDRMSFDEFDRFAVLLLKNQKQEHLWLKTGKAYPFSTTFNPMLFPVRQMLQL